LPEPLQAAIDELGVEVAAMVPADPEVNRIDAMGEALIHLNNQSPAWATIDAMVTKILGF
jgi:CO dehydrogenase nickel-insertion accessory protein CooC1